MSTIKEVAEVAGVSVATISNYLNHTKAVKEETARAIEEAIKKTNYRYNAQAAKLKRQIPSTLKTLGIISVVDKNPFFAELFFNIEKVARQCGICVISSFFSENSTEDFTKSVELLRQNCDVLLVSVIDGKAIEHELTKINAIPTLLFCINNYIKLDNVKSLIWKQNGFVGSFACAKYLLNKGARSFAMLTGPQSLETVQDRINGFKKALAESHDDSIVMSVFEGDFSFESSQRLCQKILFDKHKFDAIVCHNDLMACAFINSAAKFGLCCPKDFLLTGYDDIDIASKLTPSITTVKIDLEDLAKKLIDVLNKFYLNKLDDFTIESNPTLIARESA